MLSNAKSRYLGDLSGLSAAKSRHAGVLSPLLLYTPICYTKAIVIKAVIFDLDGTITRPFFDFDAIRQEMGLAPDSGPILELMEKMSPVERKRTRDILTSHEDRAVAESTLNDGASEVLDALRQKDISIGILTRNKRCNAEAIARKAMEIAAGICVYTNGHVTVESIDDAMEPQEHKVE